MDFSICAHKVSFCKFSYICLRWVSKNREDFIGLYQVNSITAGSLTFHIKDALLRLNLQLSQCGGQCYDRANNI